MGKSYKLKRSITIGLCLMFFVFLGMSLYFFVNITSGVLNIVWLSASVAGVVVTGVLTFLDVYLSGVVDHYVQKIEENARRSKANEKRSRKNQKRIKGE